MDTEDEFIPRISCQACGASWPIPTTSLTDPIRHRCGTRWGYGSPSSPGTAGAPGRLTHVSEILDRDLTDVSITPDNGLNTFQGRAWLTSWQWRAVRGGVFTLTVSLDSETALRLDENRSTAAGYCASEEIVFSLTMVREAQPTT